MNRSAKSCAAKSVFMLGAITVAAFLWLAACTERPTPVESNSSGKFRVYTTFYPTTDFTTRIVGGVAEVVCPLPDGEDPIFWQPSRAAVMAYQQADLIILNGAELEKWVPTVSLPLSRVVDSAASFREHFIRYDSATHNHGLKGEHAHVGVDGHTWLDPVNAKAQARAILNALIQRMPDHEHEFQENHGALALDLDDLDERWRRLAPELAKAEIFASHPAYNYLAARYSLQIINLDIDPEGETEQLSILPREVSASKRRILLWESHPAIQVADEARRLGFINVVLSPCETLSEDQREAGADFISVQNAGLDRLENAIRP